MSRRLRIDISDIVYHVLNRRVSRMTLFDKDEHYTAFEKILDKSFRKVPMRVLAYCLMPNNWHLYFGHGATTSPSPWFRPVSPQTPEGMYGVKWSCSLVLLVLNNYYVVV